MNELLKQAVQPYVDDISERASNLLAEEIVKIDEAIKRHTKVPKNQPMLDPLVRIRMGLLINGEEVEDIIPVERNYVTIQLARAVAAKKEEG